MSHGGQRGRCHEIKGLTAGVRFLFGIEGLRFWPGGAQVRRCRG